MGIKVIILDRRGRPTPEIDAEIERRIARGEWRRCPGCGMRLPRGFPCACDPDAFLRASRAMLSPGGICGPCQMGKHYHSVCRALAGCKCKVEEV